eukprot:2625169-Amphidinium_carterae.2
MMGNLKKPVVISNGKAAYRLLITTRDPGVDTQWAVWRCLVQSEKTCGHLSAIYADSAPFGNLC